MTDEQPTKKTHWHHIFAALLDELLSPLGIEVEPDVPISPQLPKIDIVLRQQTENDVWTEAQRAYLPDGIRDSLANQVTVELKITETANGEAIKQALMYDIGYQRGQQKKQNPDKPVIIQTFLVSARTPNKAVLAQYGYQPTEQAGVYRSDNIFIKDMPLILLNELSDEAHNVFFKLFASRQREKQKAVRSLQRWWLGRLSWSIKWLVQGLLQYWLKGEEKIVETLTAEQLKEQGKLVKELIFPLLTVEDWADILEGTPYLELIEQRGEQRGERRGEQIGEQKGLLKGLLKGRAEGEQKAQRAKAIALKTIRQTLVIRFHTPLEQYDAQLNSLDLSDLETLSDLVFSAKDLTQFEAELSNLSAPSQ